MAKYKDANPVAGAKAGSGIKNDDGRELGSEYSSSDDVSMDAKETYNPNLGAPKLDGNRDGAE